MKHGGKWSLAWLLCLSWSAAACGVEGDGLSSAVGGSGEETGDGDGGAGRGGNRTPSGTGGSPGTGGVGSSSGGKGGAGGGTPAMQDAGAPPTSRADGGGMADVAPPPPPVSAWMGPRLLVAVGLGGRHAISRDGTMWMNDLQDERATGESSKSFFDAVYGKEILVVVGGGCPSGTCSARLSTFNGDRWTDRTAPAEATGPITGVAFGKGTFLAVGPSGTVVTSSDGKNWTALKSVGTTLKGARRIAFGSVGGTEMFVVVGENGLRARSLDGQMFSPPLRGFPGADSEITLQAAEVGNGFVIAAGSQGRRIRSRDGLEWTDPAAGGGTLTSLVFAEGKFMAYGDATVAHVTGDNGLSWTPQTLISPPNAAVETGVMGPARLYVGFSSANATIRTSANGIAWATQATSNPAMNALTRFAFAGP